MEKSIEEITYYKSKFEGHAWDWANIFGLLSLVEAFNIYKKKQEHCLIPTNNLIRITVTCFLDYIAIIIKELLIPSKR